MAKNLVVVAIPEEQDRVWKISSEKIPHLTLLFLGDADSNPHVEDIVQFVEHAVQICQHGPFYLDVDRRGTLGPDDADVVFFSTRSWNLKWIKQFRSQLLQNENIRTAYDATDQYDEWQPHLTMGYPATPAKKLSDPFDDTIYSVRFDRIAVWVDDYDGPDFQLEWPDREFEGDSVLAYSDVGKSAVADILEHHGVLGMKWGIRRDKSKDGTVTVNVPHFGTGQLVTKKVTPKKAAKLDKKWEKEVASMKTHASVYDAGAAHFNQRIGAINDKFSKAHPKEFNDGTLWNESHPVTQAYHKEATQALKEGLQNSVNEFGPNPTGTKRVKMVTENEHSVTEFGWQLKTEKIKHAATDEEVIVFVTKQNTEGAITSIAPLTDPASQFSKVVHSVEELTDLGSEFVEHQSVLDNPDLAAQIKAKLQSILDDVTGDADKDVNLFGDPIIRVKLQSVLSDFYKDPNVTEAMVYSALGELAMEHHGIKGMHWGIRRDRSSEGPQAVHPTATSRVPAGDRRKTKIKTEGGQNIDAHPDAIRVAESKVKLKKSGPSALSNQELRDVSNRVRLESEALLLTSHKGKQFVKRQLLGQGESVARAGLREGTKRGVKKAGFAGAAAAL